MKSPDGKYIFGMVKVGEKGQIVIPKEARDVCLIKPGDTLIVLGDENKNLALCHASRLADFARAILQTEVEPK